MSGNTPGRWKVSRGDWMLLACAILLATLIRVDFLWATRFVIDADEAIVGLMAKHIIEGRGIPVFYYGQHYMGSLEPILVAGMFVIFGISSWALQTVPLIVAIGTTPAIFFLGRELGGRATAHFAALLYALPPAGLLVWSSKARGGFIEILLLGALACIHAIRWLREREPKGTQVGFLAFYLGVGWWVNNQIIYFMVSIGLCMGLRAVGEIIRRASWKERVASLSLYSWHALLGTAAFACGSAPYWIYNVQENFPSLGMFGFARIEEITEHLYGLITVALPILLGGRRFWDSATTLSAVSASYLIVYFILCAVLVAWRWKAIVSLFTAKVDTERPIEMISIFVLFSCAIFTVSTFGWLVQAPRYLLPVYVGLFPLCGVILERIGCRSKRLAVSVFGLLVLMNTVPAYVPTRALQGEPVVFKGERVDKDHTELINRLQELGINRIRANYWIGYRVAFESEERVTFLVFQEPRTVRIRSYELGISADDRDHVPLVLVPAEAVLVRVALERLGFEFKEERVGAYVLMYDLHRADGHLRVIPPNSYSVTSNVGTLPLANISDGSLASRWGTGRHQEPGQELRFTFSTPTTVAAVQIESGGWSHDYARSLVIKAETSDGETRELIAAKDYYAVKYFAAENGEVKLLFEPLQVKSIAVVQMGRHPILDWSVAEARLFEPAQAGIPAGAPREDT